MVRISGYLISDKKNRFLNWSCPTKQAAATCLVDAMRRTMRFMSLVSVCPKFCPCGRHRNLLLSISNRHALLLMKLPALLILVSDPE